MATKNRQAVYGAVAVYAHGADCLRLPIVALDGAGRAQILSLRGKLTLATKARPKVGAAVYRFARVEPTT
jgi:hypothetical protein